VVDDYVAQHKETIANKYRDKGMLKMDGEVTIEHNTTFLRVVLETPWLAFSRRTLSHFQALAERCGIPRVFPRRVPSSPWEDEECTLGCSSLHGGGAMFEYSKARPQTLCIAWCMHQMGMGWADVAEPTLERLLPGVTLELESEGPALGIAAAPRKPPFLYQRVFYSFVGLLCFLEGCSLVFETRQSSSVGFVVGGLVSFFGLWMMIGAVAIPGFIYQDEK
jgi:hypothetical protein